MDVIRHTLVDGDSQVEVRDGSSLRVIKKEVKNLGVRGMFICPTGLTVLAVGLGKKDSYIHVYGLTYNIVRTDVAGKRLVFVIRKGSTQHGRKDEAMYAKVVRKEKKKYSEKIEGVEAKVFSEKPSEGTSVAK